MTRPRSPRRLRRQALPTLLGLACVVVAATISSGGQAATTATTSSTTTTTGGVTTTTTAGATTGRQPVQLKGEGASTPYKELVHWQDDLSGAASSVDLGYVPTGDQIGRDDFIANGLDFVISGRPFSADELAKVKGGAKGLIDVPIQPAALAFTLTLPVPDGLQTLTLSCDPYDPNIPDPSVCIHKTPLAGPVRVPTRNLAAMTFKYAGTTDPPLSSWNATDTLKAMGVDNFTTPPLAGPALVMRSEPSAENYYLQLWAKTYAPDIWSALKALDTSIPWEPVSERLGRQASASRQGAEQQVLQLGLGGADPASGTITSFTAGAMAPTGPSGLQVLKEVYPKVTPTQVQVQNAAGEWVSPTTESINKAVVAGGDSALWAFDPANASKAAGAYPFVWVDHLYVRATGLSIDKTEALASTIRYLATTGQQAAAPLGEGQLSPALRAKALAGADALVTSSCTGADRTIVRSADIGPYAPATPEVKAIGAVLHCQPAAAATTTTTAPPATAAFADPGATTDPYATDTGATSDLGLGDTSASTGTLPASATPPPTTAATKVDKVKVKARPVVLLSTLPLSQPDPKQGGWRFTAMLFGAGLVLVLRPWATKLYRRVRP